MADFAYLIRTENGACVQSLGDAPVFGGACCGAEFKTVSAAVEFLRSHGFQPSAAGCWVRPAA